MEFVDITLEGVEIDEALEYIQNAPKGTYAIYIKADGEFADIEYAYKHVVPFERIRRITGYLVGTMERWNNAKIAEEHDRVKHTVPIDDIS